MNVSTPIWFLLLLLWFISFSRAEAQTCCSAGAPVTSSLGIQTNEENWLNIQVEYGFKSINRLVSENELLQNDPRTRNGSNFLIKADLQVHRHWAISTLLPVVHQSRTTTSQREASIGLGDLIFFAQYGRQAPENNLFWSLAGGIKVPTGVVNHQDDRGIFLSPDMQSGSGTIDYLGRASIGKRAFLVKSLTAQVHLTYRKNTTNTGFGSVNGQGGRRFKFGDELQAEMGISHEWLWGNWYVVPDWLFRYRVAGANVEQQVDAPNSGGQWWMTGLGISVLPSPLTRIRLYGILPFAQQLEGLQITTDLELGIQCSYAFKQKPKPVLINPSESDFF